MTDKIKHAVAVYMNIRQCELKADRLTTKLNAALDTMSVEDRREYARLTMAQDAKHEAMAVLRLERREAAQHQVELPA